MGIVFGEFTIRVDGPGGGFEDCPFPFGNFQIYGKLMDNRWCVEEYLNVNCLTRAP